VAKTGNYQMLYISKKMDFLIVGETVPIPHLGMRGEKNIEQSKLK
jgi:hypothetical protein